MKPKTCLKKSFKFLSLASALVLVLMALCPTQTRANTIALDFTGGVRGLAAADLTVGWAFSLSSAVLLTDLGLWDGGGNGFGGSIGDGLAQSHLVTIWTSAGTFVTSATVPSGTSGTLVDDFRYISVAPLLLAAGDYVIGGFYQDGSQDSFILEATTVTTASGVTYNGSRAAAGNTFPPGDPGDNPNSYFGPNFQFTDTDHFVGVPEGSSTWILMTLGIACTFGLNLLLRRRSAAG